MPDSKMKLAEMYPHPPDCEAEIFEAGGLKWVKHIALIDAGYKFLEDFMIVLVNGTFYELQAHTKASYRIIGKHYPSGIWWVEEVDEEVPEDVDDTGA